MEKELLLAQSLIERPYRKEPRDRSSCSIVSSAAYLDSSMASPKHRFRVTKIGDIRAVVTEVIANATYEVSAPEKTAGKCHDLKTSASCESSYTVL